MSEYKDLGGQIVSFYNILIELFISAGNYIYIKLLHG